ncbi:MAG TPA: hypothetical protein DCY27_13210 [Desulfobacterales bacterium]|nr:hypothetical protein [Desulfobacterales bacterium]
MLDLEALLQLLAEKYGDQLPLKRGCVYSLKISQEEVFKIFGEEDAVGQVAYQIRCRQAPDGNFLCKIKRWQQAQPRSLGCAKEGEK